jgi:hypothetical protein
MFAGLLPEGTMFRSILGSYPGADGRAPSRRLPDRCPKHWRHFMPSKRRTVKLRNTAGFSAPQSIPMIFDCLDVPRANRYSYVSVSAIPDRARFRLVQDENIL